MANEQNQNPQQRRRPTFLDKLSPQQRKWVTVGSVIAIAVLGVYMLTKEDKPRNRNNEVTNVLTDVSSRDMGIDSLLAQIKISNDNVQKLEREISKLRKEQEMTRSESSENRRAISRVSKLEKDFTAASQDLNSRIEVLSQNLTRANEENAELRRRLEGGGYEHPAAPDAQPGGAPQISGNRENSAADSSVGTAGSLGADRPSFDEISKNFKRPAKPDFLTQPIDLNDPEKLYAQAPLPAAASAVTTEDGTVLPSATLTTNFISAADPEDDSSQYEMPEPEMFIPAGSMLKGVLLAGLDAPTGNEARKDPFPVNVRIQQDAIMPNGWRADLKECFLLMSGYGDMSSERALLRGETLSCIKEDGAIIQAKLPSYAAGEDGKAGLRGRLVSKTGSILAKTLLAGFASGVSEAFDVNMTPTINTSSDGTVSYEQVYAPEAFQGAAISGVSNALDRLADYYMSMAEEMFPIIEIDGGREVTVIVSNGATLTKVREADGSAVKKQNVITDTAPAQ